MSSQTATIGLITVLAAALSAAAPSEQGARSGDAPRWFRGNTHTHSLNNDGDSTPEDVARWYREHGYNFVVFTDHEFITPIDGLNAVIGAQGRFMVMSGQEVTGRFNTTPVHANGLGLTTVVMPRTGVSPLDALTAGRRLFAVADDDAHHFKRLDDPTAAAPHRGWVMVRSLDLTQAAIIDAMRRGDCYASTGVTLSDVQATATQLRVVITTTTYSKYRVQFIGAGGRLLAEATEPTAEYTFKGNEQYVRARIVESNRKMAWTQPAFLASPR